MNTAAPGPKSRYQQLLDSGEFDHDPAQAVIVGHLDRLHHDLIDRQRNDKTGIAGLFSSLGSQRKGKGIPMGLYIWGGVGRGKTHLLDMFVDNLPFNDKLRVHFHRFMRLVHDELNALKDVNDPLEIVAERFAHRTRILCLDEIQVSDITDAMLMAGLFKALFAGGVTLITTANVAPDNLYPGGLQRQRFIPAIELIKTHTHVVNMGGEPDYRLRALEQARIYHTPLDTSADLLLEQYFHHIAAVERHHNSRTITINHRNIPVIMWADGIAWFEFGGLCNTPRSQDDYIEIAQYFHSVIISNIPQMDKTLDDAARRFVKMIDEFYDRNVKLIVSAEVPAAQLYTGLRLQCEFERTTSRLGEMQSQEYLSRKHLR